MPSNQRRHHRRTIRLKGYDYRSPGLYYVTICANRRGEVFGHKSGGSIILNPIGRIVQAIWLSLPEHYAHIRLDAFVVMPDHIHGIIVITGDGDGGAGIGAVDVIDDVINGGIDDVVNDAIDVAFDVIDDVINGGIDDVVNDAIDVGTQRAASLRVAPTAPTAPAGIDAPADDGGDGIGAVDAMDSIDVGTQRAASRRAAPDALPALDVPVAPRLAPGSLPVIVRAFKSAATREVNAMRGTPRATLWQGRYYEHIIRDEADLNRIRRYIASNPARWKGGR
ncbi:MAG: hypothetical protein N2378_03730 [Chloroflexaceae bacterium]|nr:hypothetical protein [Chloroflexaceae bacterium]